jgi:hypothetical protein
LPVVNAHSENEWRKLLDQMAPRANLKPTEQEAALAYLTAARATL